MAAELLQENGVQVWPGARRKLRGSIIKECIAEDTLQVTRVMLPWRGAESSAEHSLSCLRWISKDIES